MKAVVDRIEDNVAVVLFSDAEIQVNIPTQLLPENTSEGSWLKIDIMLDEEGAKSQRSKIRSLLNKLENKKLNQDS